MPSSTTDPGRVSGNELAPRCGIAPARSIRFLGAMRFLFLLGAFASAACAAVPADLAAALATFRTDSPRGWSFTQTTEGEGHSRIERFDAARPEFDRWTLLRQDGTVPTADKQLDYKQKLVRRSSNSTAPLITEQLDLRAPETLADTAERATYRCRLKPGEAGDKTAAFLRVTLVVHKPTHTVESLEISNDGEFQPTWGVTIAEMKTAMTYSLPDGATPSLPQKVTTHLRGRAFYFKSLDADMTVAYTDYVKAGKK